MGEDDGVSSPDIVTDAILGGRLRLRQMRRGHRAGTDAVLLAAAATLAPGDVVIDVGAGVGTIGLALALRAQDLSGVLLEADPIMARLAVENCALNSVAGRIGVAVCDLFDPAARRAAGVAEGSASLVVTNPPFYDHGKARPSIHPGKSRAYHLGADGLSPGHADWLRAALALLAPGGRFCLIHRPEALPALLSGAEGRLGAIRIRPVHARPEAEAIRILLSGVKASRAPLRLCSPLVLHGAGGAFTREVEALHRGEALIEM